METSVEFGDFFDNKNIDTTSTQHPIYVIDQANELKSLLRDKDGQAALERLFRTFVRHTKEQHNLMMVNPIATNHHVILISSESFFDQWVEGFVGPSNYSVYVVGHLDKEEAESYWNQTILSKWLKKNDAPPTFDKAFEVCGGSMYLMDKFFHEYCQEPSNGLIHRDAIWCCRKREG